MAQFSVKIMRLPGSVLGANQQRDNLRVTPAAQAAAPTQVQIRSDFAPAFDVIVTRLRNRGCELPILSTTAPLPAEGQPVPDEILPILGRSLRLVSGLALRDPATDSFLIVDAGGGATTVHARQVTTDASDAGALADVTLAAFTCDAATCTAADVTLRAEELGPLFATAGWFPAALAAPTSLGATGGFANWRNITGLVAGETTLGDELNRLFSPPQIVGSALRDRTGHVWDGTAFAAP